MLLLECNTHDTIAIHLFQCKLIIFLKEKFEVLKITYLMMAVQHNTKTARIQ